MRKTGAEHFNDITANCVASPSPINVSILDDYLEHWMGTNNKKNKADIKGKIEKELLLKKG